MNRILLIWILICVSIPISFGYAKSVKGKIIFLEENYPEPDTVKEIDIDSNQVITLVQATSERPSIREFHLEPKGTRFLVSMGHGDNWYANTEIYVGEEGGKKLKKLTDNSIYDGDPAWSPDGKRIAFTRGWGIDGRVLVLDMGLGQEQQVPTIGLRITRFPAWLPDSRRLVVTAKPLDSDHGIWGFAEINISKGAVRWLYRGNFIGDYPFVSPDGTKIAFILQKRPKRTLMSYIRRTGPDWVYRIKILDVSTGRLLSAGGCASNFEDDSKPAWSPDGKQLAWLRHNRKKRTSRLFVYSFESKKLWKTRFPAASLVWSPDSKCLACFMRGKLCIVTVNSGQAKDVLVIKSPIEICCWR